MRRQIATFLATIVLVGALLGPGVGVAAAQGFSDVGTGDWFYTAVEQLSAAGVVNGFSDGAFRPYEPVTRAQFASMLARAVAPPQVFDEPFADVYSTDWFYGSVASLYQAGLISGTSATTFSPGRTIDRQQAATLVMRGLAYVQAWEEPQEPGGDPEQPATSGLTGSDEGTPAPVEAASDPATDIAGVTATAPDAAAGPSELGAEETTTTAGPDVGLGVDPGSETPGPAAETTPATGSTSVPAQAAELAAVPAQAAVDLALSEDQIQAWLAGFKDRGFIDSAHRPAVANAYRYSVVSGSGDGWFYPTFGLSRAQAAGILYRALYTPLAERSAPPTPVPAAGSYPNLSRGSTGFLVSFIESRLSALRYDVGRLDGVYDEALRDAVRAFQKVEGLSRDGEVGPQVWGRIGSARVPAPRYSTGGNRVEIDLSRQVLLLVNGGKIVKILPIASGAPGWNTPTGHYRITRKLPYWRESALGLLYKPSYFVGGIAIHGSYSIPPYAASHGCVRVPVWATDALYPQLPVGMPVDVYY